MDETLFSEFNFSWAGSPLPASTESTENPTTLQDSLLLDESAHNSYLPVTPISLNNEEQFPQAQQPKQVQVNRLKFVSMDVGNIGTFIKRPEGKAFLDSALVKEADFLCLQKIHDADVDKFMDHFRQLFGPDTVYFYALAPSQAKVYGNSGVFTIARHRPLQVMSKHLTEQPDDRILAFFYKEFILVNVIVPWSGRLLTDLCYRLDWDAKLTTFLKELQTLNPNVIVAGDFNCSPAEIDLSNPYKSTNAPGFTGPERRNFFQHLEAGYVDTFRRLHPQRLYAYTWWKNKTARKDNAGQRLDFFLVSNELSYGLVDAQIYQSVMGSQHCPISLTLDIPRSC